MSLLVLQGVPVQRLHEQLWKDESKTPLKKVSVYDSSGFKVYMHPLWCTTYIVSLTNLIVLVQILTSSSKGFEDFVSFYMIYMNFSSLIKIIRCILKPPI